MRREIEKYTDDLGYAHIQEYETFKDGDVVFEYPTYMGLVDKNGKQIVPCKYHNIIKFYNNAPLAPVELNNLWGYINQTGREVVPCHYSFADDKFYCGLAMVTKNDNYGFINSEGFEIIHCQYDDAHICWDNLCAVCYNGKWGVIDKNNNTIVSFEYDYANVMGNDRIIVCRYEKYGLLDYNGKVIVGCMYDGLSNILSDGRIEYKRNGEHGFMDLNGGHKEILPF